MADTLLRLESFPFDSKQDGYDDDGYPIYDRAIGADVLRQTFAKFFSDGVFPSPADTLQVSKAASGIAVTVKPGLFIINGAMGVVKNQTMINLVDGTQVGKVTYSIMLRFDENDDKRSCYIRVANGGAGAAAVQPESGVGIKEYRLATVEVPNGATDMSGAKIVNEKGLAICPYAAPFEEIDLSEVVRDAQNQAENVLQAYLAYVDKYYSLVQSAVDGTTAAELRKEIDHIKQVAINSDSLDSNYFAMQDIDGDKVNKLGLVANAIKERELSNNVVTEEKISASAVTTDKLEDNAVTSAKLSVDLQNKIGVLDTSTWDADRYLTFTNSLSGDDAKNTFVTEHVTKSVFNKWEIDKQIAYLNAIPTASQTRLGGFFDYTGTSWENLKKYGNEAPIAAVKPAVGKIRNVTITGYGSVPCAIVGVRADTKVSGGKAAFTFDCKKLLFKDKLNDGYVNDGYDTWTIYAKLNNEVFGKIESGVKSLIEDVVKDKIYCTGYSGNAVKGTFNAKVWVMSNGELFGSKVTTLQDGAQYELFSSGGAKSRKKTMIGGTTSFDNYYWTRTPFKSNYGWDSCSEVNDNGSMVSSSSNYMNEPSGIPIAFCI